VEDEPTELFHHLPPGQWPGPALPAFPLLMIEQAQVIGHRLTGGSLATAWGVGVMPE
jgi:hypothetical protein